ncbi:MAG: hypothetical protein OHK0056_31670 [Bacteriovoracaceae bacterium]
MVKEIPLLEEGLEILSLGQSLLFIEFKDSIITKNDVEIIKKYYGDRPEKVAIISFHEEVLSLVKQWSLSDDFLSKIKTVLLKKFGFFRGQKSADFLSAKYIHKSRAQRLRNKGMLVGAYTKNEVDKIEKYLDKDLDFITTNEYKRCRELVEKRK